MHYKIEVINNAITTTFRWSLAASSSQFWRPGNFENLVSPDFKNFKHLQKLGNYVLTVSCIYNVI